MSQHQCDASTLAPDGCLQYYFGTTKGTVESFNFGGELHLANQNQNICIRYKLLLSLESYFLKILHFRRESNQCRICWSHADNEFDISGGGPILGTNGRSVRTIKNDWRNLNDINFFRMFAVVMEQRAMVLLDMIASSFLLPQNSLLVSIIQLTGNVIS